MAVPVFLHGGPFRRTSRSGVVAVAVTLGLVLLPVPGLFRVSGAPLEEGLMLYLPELLGRGLVPNVDFLFLYGPGSLQVLAGWYAVVGHSLEAERTFGLLQLLAVVAALYVIGRPWGPVVAAGTATTGALVLLPSVGLVALPWVGALALGLWTVVFAVRARTLTGPAARWCWATAGLLAGLAVCYRPDIAIAAGLALAVAGWRDRRAAWLPLAAGLFVGLLPLVVHVAIAGLDASIQGMVLDPVVELRPGRRLPAPPPWNEPQASLAILIEQLTPRWPLPAPNAYQQTFLWFWAMVLLGVGIPASAWWRRRRGDQRAETVGLLVAGVFALGILGQGLQRPDPTHLAWVTAASWPLLVPVIADAVSRSRRLPAVPRRRPGPTACVAVLALVLFVIPLSTFRPVNHLIRVGLGLRPASGAVSNGNRSIYATADADLVQQAVDDLARWSSPGERLIVGPQDLSRTVYNDTILYWLFPDLEPGTYYLEMDPGVADDADSGLAGEVERADWVLLTTFWAGWWEPNASSEHGSPAPNEVLAARFCLAGTYGRASSDTPVLLLLRNCGPGNGGGLRPTEVTMDSPTDPPA